MSSSSTTDPSHILQDLALDHVEMYVVSIDARLADWQKAYDFTLVGRAGSEDEGFRSVAIRQGAIMLVLTEATGPRHPAAAYVRAHGDGVADIALSTSDLAAVYPEVLRRGARPVSPPRPVDGDDVVAVAKIGAFGDVVHTLVQRREGEGPGLPVGFSPEAAEFGTHPAGAGPVGLQEIDHFAFCVPVGQLDPLIAYYRDALGFDETFGERIVIGRQAMLSKVVQNARGVTFTIIQPDPAAEPGQIDGFLAQHGGAGVQHIAFSTEDAIHSVRTLTERGVAFLHTPRAYYALLGERIRPHRHTMADLLELSILVDEDHGGQLFQIFTRTTHERRTLFFEVIERLGARTFGSSNIKALYEAVELERQSVAQ
jgi:4-hydroxymandelate synthase